MTIDTHHYRWCSPLMAATTNRSYDRNGVGLEPANNLPGWFLTCILLVATAIGGSLFSHESRISRNEVTQERLNRLEVKVDRVLEVLRVATHSPEPP